MRGAEPVAWPAEGGQLRHRAVVMSTTDLDSPGRCQQGNRSWLPASAWRRKLFCTIVQRETRSKQPSSAGGSGSANSALMQHSCCTAHQSAAPRQPSGQCGAAAAACCLLDGGLLYAPYGRNGAVVSLS